ncbi:hypothetical protein ASPBRDRAFT_35068 [Aspergillus brasiliensis CBS 101740]|uniref:Uncharacterized protein n=1 Tax=Aspergillus brasiliensis (strain CBS 101740 / IMI 381727 / IBT 21946) TaxID=767769 RepID=A0A1L9U3N8_ASPBC|nr:hypothetical protein ASPBRDRAFT_35068 [Aspergillus brasiliensis CBS 101740]
MLTLLVIVLSLTFYTTAQLLASGPDVQVVPVTPTTNIPAFTGGQTINVKIIDDNDPRHQSTSRPGYHFQTTKVDYLAAQSLPSPPYATDRGNTVFLSAHVPKGCYPTFDKQGGSSSSVGCRDMRSSAMYTSDMIFPSRSRLSPLPFCDRGSSSIQARRSNCTASGRLPSFSISHQSQSKGSPAAPTATPHNFSRTVVRSSSSPAPSAHHQVTVYAPTVSSRPSTAQSLRSQTWSFNEPSRLASAGNIIEITSSWNILLLILTILIGR